MLLLLLLLLPQHLLNPELQNADQHFLSRFETLKNFEPTYFFLRTLIQILRKGLTFAKNLDTSSSLQTLLS